MRFVQVGESRVGGWVGMRRFVHGFAGGGGADDFMLAVERFLDFFRWCRIWLFWEVIVTTES